MSKKNHHILYTNESRSVVLIDIPASISSAQGYDARLSLPTFDRRLVSCSPVVQQYQTPEPKTKPSLSKRYRGLTASDDGEIEEDLQYEIDKGYRKTAMASKVSGNGVKDIEHARYRELIIGALVEIRENYEGPLCGKRQLRDGKVWSDEPDDLGFEKIDHEEIKDKELKTVNTIETKEEENTREERQVRLANDEESVDLGTLLAQLCESEVATSKARFSYMLSPLKLSEFEDPEDDQGSETEGYCQRDKHEVWEGFVYNSKDYIRLLSIFDSDSKIYSSTDEARTTNSIKFFIPPRSVFLLNDCNDTASFHAAVRNMSNGAESDHNNSRQFDLVTLDPPWPNASAKRKRNSKRTGEGYRTKPTLREISKLLSGMDVDRLIASDGLVAIWITNKPAVRALVLGPGGLFEQWNVNLVEEWVWVKVTCRGEPVTPLDGSWRKPYEVLLLARAPADQLKYAVHERERKLQDPESSKWPEVKCKVLVAVPDLHSRKPCLKSLLEPMVSTDKLNEPKGATEQMRKSHAYRALEIFARHLVAGWWSWGDQVLLYQWEGSWSSSSVMANSTERGYSLVCSQ